MEKLSKNTANIKRGRVGGLKDMHLRNVFKNTLDKRVLEGSQEWHGAYGKVNQLDDFSRPHCRNTVSDYSFP